MDLEAESTRIKVDTDVTSDIAKSCNKLLELQKQMKKCEAHLKTLQDEERLLSEQEIPNLMQNAGALQISFVDIKPFYAAKIPVSKTDEAFQWLRDNGFGDIIKNNVTVSFGKSEDNAARVIYEDLKSAGHNVIQKEKVEPSTLKAFVREQIENGRDVPMDLFGVYVANKTKIKGEK